MSPARWLAGIAVLLLGAAAASHLPWVLTAAADSHDLTVTVSGPPVADLDELARTGAAPVEAVLRQLGAAATASRVDPGAAVVRARFAPGVELARQRALLEIALAPLRARLYAGFSLEVGGDSPDEAESLVWLGPCDDRTARSLASAWRSLPGIAAVEPLGLRRDAIAVELDPLAADTEPAVEAALVRAATPRQVLGPRVADTSRSWLAVAPGSGATALGAAEIARLTVDLPDRTLPLTALARVTLGSVADDTAIDVNGVPGRALLVRRSVGAAPFAVARRLREAVAALPPALGARLLIDPTAPLGRLRRDLAIALGLVFLLAILLGVWQGGWRGGARSGAALIVALGGAACGLAASASVLSPATVPLLPLAITAALGVRWTVGASGRIFPETLVLLVSTAALPLGLKLAGGTPEIAGAHLPALAFAAATLGALAAVALVPGGPAAAGSPRTRRGVRTLLRERAAMLLLGATAVDLLLAFGGEHLAPVFADPRRSEADIEFELARPEGTTLAETHAEVLRFERELRGIDGVAGTFSRTTRRAAVIAIRLASERRQGRARELVLARVRLAVAGGNTAQIRVATGEAGELALLGGADLDHRLHAEPDPQVVRLLLRADSVATLRSSRDQLIATLRRKLKILPSQIQFGDAVVVDSEARSASFDAAIEDATLAAISGSAHGAILPPADPWVTLNARPGTTPAALQRAVAAIARQVTAVRRFPANRPDDPEVLLLPPGRSADEERLPQRTALLDAPLPGGGRGQTVTAGALLTADERLVETNTAYEDGRFLLPVNLQLSTWTRTKEARTAQRLALARGLAHLQLPEGSQLETPPLSLLSVWRERAALLTMAAVVLLVFLGTAVVRLQSWRAGLAALAPLLPAAGAAAVTIGMTSGRTDVLGGVVLAAVLAGTMPAATAAAAAARGPSGIAGPYRALGRLAPGLVAAALIATALPAVMVAQGNLVHDGWVASLAAAAAASAVGGLAALTLVPALLAPRRRRPFAVTLAATRELTVRNVSKTYRGGARALRRVSFSLQPGIVGLLGPNGSGKTTLLRILVGLLAPTRGDVRYRGEPLRGEVLVNFRRALGFMPQEFSAYPALTGEGFMAHWAAARDIQLRPGELAALIELVRLTPHAQRKVRSYSGGMRRRLGMAAALIGAPPVLIVDEPTAGLDFEARGVVREVLLAAGQDRIVVLSTHLASDVEAVAGRLLVLRAGRLCFDGRSEELIARARGRVEERVLGDEDTEFLREMERRRRVTAQVRRLDGLHVRLVLAPGETPRGAATEPTLEEAYLALLDEP